MKELQYGNWDLKVIEPGERGFRGALAGEESVIELWMNGFCLFSSPLQAFFDRQFGYVYVKHTLGLDDIAAVKKLLA